MEDLNHKLQEEKESKLNLSVKLNDLEKSYQEEQSDKDQVTCPIKYMSFIWVSIRANLLPKVFI